jgi:hypothetical protein
VDEKGDAKEESEDNCSWDRWTVAPLVGRISERKTVAHVVVLVVLVFG